MTKGHPLNIIKKQIENYFNDVWGKKHGAKMSIFDDLSPVMNTYKAFDELLIPLDHPGRQPTDTYYLSQEQQILLRPHTSAHQNEILREGITSFLCTGDVYRRDSIDATHFPIFHQMEGVHVFPKEALPGVEEKDTLLVVEDMKMALEGLAKHLFGDVKFRWNSEYFPFTDPSYELEIFFREQWLEVLGCGAIHQQILKNTNLSPRRGWAFGLGLERLAMILFSIPDIRLFWSGDQRFLSQFSSPSPSTPLPKFKPYSKHEICTKDISFWLPPSFHDHAFFDVVRDVAGDLVENVTLIDSFKDVSSGRESKCFRVSYRSMDRNLTNKEIVPIQEQVRARCESELGLKLR
uniref:phenylalanine--tRNA ligase n=1 Tax=Arcella intermedia TaxID=1963864 RepID=A0A6B2L7L0_9EUKA